jgi:hypothetical protein
MHPSHQTPPHKDIHRNLSQEQKARIERMKRETYLATVPLPLPPAGVEVVGGTAEVVVGLVGVEPEPAAANLAFTNVRAACPYSVP